MIWVPVSIRYVDRSSVSGSDAVLANSFGYRGHRVSKLTGAAYGVAAGGGVGSGEVEGVSNGDAAEGVCAGGGGAGAAGATSAAGGAAGAGPCAGVVAAGGAGAGIWWPYAWGFALDPAGAVGAGCGAGAAGALLRGVVRTLPWVRGAGDHERFTIPSVAGALPPRAPWGHSTSRPNISAVMYFPLLRRPLCISEVRNRHWRCRQM